MSISKVVTLNVHAMLLDNIGITLLTWPHSGHFIDFTHALPMLALGLPFQSQ